MPRVVGKRSAANPVRRLAVDPCDLVWAGGASGSGLITLAAVWFLAIGSTVICARVARNGFNGEKTARVDRNGEGPAGCLVASIKNLVWIVAIAAIAVFWLGL